MSKAQLVNKLLVLEPKLAVQALKNDMLSAKLKTDNLLNQLNLKVK
jgi:hypothetical protein